MRLRSQPSRPPASVVVLAFCLLSQGLATAADSATVAASIALNAPGCGSLAELNEQVARRSSRIELEPSPRPGRIGRGRGSMTAEIKDLGAGRREIVLSVVQEAGQSFSRRLETQSCKEAIEALALLIVLALDPDAAKASRPIAGTRLHGNAAAKDRKHTATTQGSLTSGDRAESEVPDRVDNSANEAEGLDRNPAAAVDLSQRVSPPGPVAIPLAPQALPSPPKVAARPLASETRLASQSSWRGLLIAGAGGLGATGIAPRAMLGGSLVAVLGWDRNSLWSPAIGIGVAHSERNALEMMGGTASFALTAAQVEACPMVLGMHRRLGARLCGLLVAGVLTAQGTRTLAPEIQRRVFSLFGASAGVMVEPGWRLVLLATGALAVPQQRYAYQFDPDVFYRVAKVSASVCLAMALRLY